MTAAFSKSVSLCSFTVVFFSLGALGLSAQENRLRGPIETSADETVVLQGNVPAKALLQNDVGPVDAATVIHDVKLVLGQTAEQITDLEQLLERQRDPSSADYRRWLSPEQFAERFGLSENDVAYIAGWLQSRGFTVEQVARARNWITFTGDAQQMGAAFHTELHRYEMEGRKHFANATDPSIPAALAGVVVAIRGLNDFHPKPVTSAFNMRPDMNAANGNHYIAPADFATIYDLLPLYEATYDGTGQKLVIAGQTDINISDMRGFRSQFNLAAKDPQLVLTGADPGVSPDDQIEADLDLEWSGAVARNATIVYVYSQDVFESVQYAIDQNLAPVISVSYGGCETGSPALSYRPMVQQANAQGITWMNASGDSAAAGCDDGEKIATHAPAVTFPADIPEVTGVGGTELVEGSGSYWSSAGSALSYIPEKAWNDTSPGEGLAGSGGGASALFSKPWWQTGTGVPNDAARDVPDVSLAASGAHDPYVIYANGSLMAIGGTSVASPSFAGIIAILNQYLVATKILAVPGLGNLNPSLYSMAQNVKGPFHDITVGNNVVPCATGVTDCVAGNYGYQAGTGYDLATGLGSVDAENFVTKWTSVAATTGTKMTLSASPATLLETGTTQLNATITAVTGSAAPSGTVTFAAGTASLGSAVLTGSGATAGATLTVKGASLATGANAITATYAGTTTFSPSSATATVTVSQPTVATTITLTASPIAVSQTGSTILTATLKPASGSAAPAGTVLFSSGNTQLGSASLASSTAGDTASLTVKGASLAVGAYAVIATFNGESGFAGSSSAPLTITVTQPVIATTLTLTANPASLAQNSTTTLSAIVKPASGSASPTGTVTFTAGNTPLGTANLSASATATLTLKGTSLAIGSNAISAVYSGTTGFAGSTGTTTVAVTAPPILTTLTLTSAPSTVASSASTTLTGVVKAASEYATPTGSVTFAIAGTSLGSAVVAASGTAALTVKASALALGANAITATYIAAGNFTGSTASTIVTVQPIVATMTLAANPTVFAQTGSTQLTVTLKASSGTVSPTGSITFSTGKTSLGTVTLVVGTGGTATAGLTLKGSSLAVGSNTINVVYTGSNFTSAAGSLTVTVTNTAAVSRLTR